MDDNGRVEVDNNGDRITYSTSVTVSNSKTEPDEIDTWLTDELICPHCGAENYAEPGDPDGVTMCCECGRVFEFERDYTVYYTSRKVMKNE